MQLKDAWAEMRRATKGPDALAQQMRRREGYTWADVTTLLKASWRSLEAGGVLELAVGRVAGMSCKRV